MFKRILVPLDGSPLAEAVLPRVQELVRSLGAELCLLRVTEAHVFPGVDPTAEEVDVVQKAEAYVANLAVRLRAAGIRVHTAVRYGEASHEILAHIADNAIDLVAMSTHGRSNLSRLLLGSVAEHVVRHARVPVLLLRAQGKDGSPAGGGQP
ncbi:MAG TPA: universal stress protein [Candidatus Baltobacteraceae bacterium]|nr:universal stress protein [Candidatus Baltobacteraceae bacterium]